MDSTLHARNGLKFIVLEPWTARSARPLVNQEHGLDTGILTAHLLPITHPNFLF